MMELVKLTVEEVVRLAFKKDPTAITKVMGADNNSILQLVHTQDFEVNAKYAKAILKDYIDENCSN